MYLAAIIMGAVMLVPTLYALWPALLFVGLIPVVGYLIRKWHPAIIVAVAVAYFAIPWSFWKHASTAIQNAELAYQADIDALPVHTLPEDLPSILLVSNLEAYSQATFDPIRCTARPKTDKRKTKVSDPIPPVKQPLPERYLLLELVRKVPLPDPGHSFFGYDGGPFALTLVDRGKITTIRYYQKVRFEKLSIPPILTVWGWLHQFEPPVYSDAPARNAVTFLRETIGRCADFAIYDLDV
ncbi:MULTISPECIES: hypothetical protein [unclassified Rhizobium]|uniref:hypothetical protein n=1 Tax=unclassified Rhizobium TaxID=2613769 RepID=UPI002167F18F|nr:MULTISPECIES: hypothetical protein [unclassified Rhizobium]MCS3742595.1 hypothetical protein [Rhizobium sp. BK661]MCS4094561.1 hypothetical protein [Rhizobium sp. BK176]